ncbi:sigma-54 dependent transcriptional regulator [Shewanella salipaludis]|uniref:Sigma-54-dependent Fis family transcriptional regulator n=1 Tax=Shewanella salipaludis TaxID=2723052 RepID=A0A972FVX5_9GAMM|nr:sigma-54 dependent transcriptional regulator [Shewanella salipaludis]NMH66746.1 sigma-54-dependent Fis family transcriptional regulator [Shewanella salipaludis]
MSHLSIRVVGLDLPARVADELLQSGMRFWDESLELPWLTLVALSDCRSSDVAERLARHPGQNQVALLAPEQSELAAAAMRAGVQDYLLIPVAAEQLLALIHRLHRLEQPDTSLVVAAAVSRQLLMLAHRAAATEASVLLSGESGTGKEPLAHYIHRHSSRADKAFVAINCAAIPESMLESVLFGHVKGAFTGAIGDKPGKFEQANGGTLLLDEIGEMPLLLQAKLLRVLQEREVERLGGHQSIALDIRVIASTNKDLRQAVDEGSFREDLFYRLDVLPLKISPLRERKADILPLAEHFLRLYDTQDAGNASYFSDHARQLLVAHEWPGNVRELENCIQRALVLRRGQAIQAAELGLTADKDTVATETDSAPSGLKASKRQAEFQYIVDILKRCSGNRSHSADALGMTTRALRYKLAQMRDAGIDVDQLLQRAGHAA